MNIIDHITNGITNHNITDYGKFTFPYGAYEIQISITQEDNGKWKPEKRISVEIFYSPSCVYSEFDKPEDAFRHAAMEAIDDLDNMHNPIE